MAGDEGRVPPYLRLTESYDHRSVPPGWDENPTAWPKRIGLAGLASVGFIIALYLSLFQLGLIESVWDPFFESPKVLEHLGWPDAIPGVLAYGGEVVLSLVGDKNRWRTAPWTVIAFGMIIFPGAAVSTVLMMAQPLAVDAWCTLCLVSALISFIICGWGADEPLAALQHLKRVKNSGGSVWRAFWGPGAKVLLPMPLRRGEE
jgi:hypothetical protein